MLLNNVKEKKCVFCLFPLEISRWEEEEGEWRMGWEGQGIGLQAGKTIQHVDKDKLIPRVPLLWSDLPGLATAPYPFSKPTRFFITHLVAILHLIWTHWIVKPDLNWCDTIYSLYLCDLVRILIDFTTEIAMYLTTVVASNPAEDFDDSLHTI